MMMPKPGDLINIDKCIPGVIIDEQSDYNKSWGFMLINIEPGQHGLVLEVYVPNALLGKPGTGKADILLQPEQEKMCKKLSPSKKPPYKSVPPGVLILVATIGEHIIELVWNPEKCSILSI